MPAGASAASRTYTVVVATVPDDPTVTAVPLPAKPLVSEVVETSKPLGGVTVIPAFMLEPATAKLVALEAVPLVVLMVESEPMETIIGMGTALTKLPVEEVVMLTLVAPLLDNTMFRES